MSKYIRSYNNESEYRNDSSIPKDASSVGDVKGYAKFNGVNVVKENKNGIVSLGDHLVYDKEDEKYKWIQAGTFNRSVLDQRYIDAKAIFICNIDGRPFVFGVESLGSPRWGEYGRYVLRGFDLDNGGSASITVNQSGGSGSTLNFSWSAGATMTDVLNSYKAAVNSIAGYYKTYSGASLSTDGSQINIYAWYGPKTATGCDLVLSKCITPSGQVVDANPSNVALANVTDSVLTEIGYNAMSMKDSDAGLIFGTKQYAVYMSAQSSGTAYGDERTVFMNKATFDALEGSETDTLGLYKKYNGDYWAYAAVCAELRRSNPDVRFKTTKTLRRGDVATRVLASVKMYDYDGVTLRPAFPAMDTANNYGIVTAGVTTGFEPGNWHLLGVVEMLKLLHYVRRVNSDPIDDINKAITEGGGALVTQNTSYALCGAGAANIQLVVGGASGGYGSSARINGDVCRVALEFDYDH